MTKALKNAIAYGKQLLTLERELRKDYVRKYLQTMRDSRHREPRVVQPHELEEREGAIGQRNLRARVMSAFMVERAIDGKLLPRDEYAISHRAFSGYHNKKHDKSTE